MASVSDIPVRRVQCALNAAGASLVVDGTWGPATAEALRRFNTHGYEVVSMSTGMTIATLDDRLIAQLPSCTRAAPRSEQEAMSSFPWWLLAGAGVVTILAIWGVSRA